MTDTGEMAQSIKHLLCKLKDLNLDPQFPFKKPVAVMCVYNPCTGKTATAGFLGLSGHLGYKSVNSWYCAISKVESN